MGRSRIRLVLAATWFGPVALTVLPGCAQPGPIASPRNMVGSLKASVSQLEYDNTNLRKQVADMQTETTRAENKLVQAEDEIRRQGGDPTALTRSPSARPEASTASNDEIPAPVQSPVRRSRSTRKPPAAQIPRIEPRPDPGPGQIELGRDGFDPGPQASSFAADGRWLPVARGRSRAGAVEVR